MWLAVKTATHDGAEVPSPVDGVYEYLWTSHTITDPADLHTDKHPHGTNRENVLQDQKQDRR